MLPVVLCGGYSTRMGEDKGLMKWNDKPMASISLSLLQRQFHLVPSISIRPAQQEFYKKVFPEIELITDDENLFLGGPLKGILSVHKRHPNKNLFVLACDMPLISLEILQKINRIYESHQEKDIVICTYQDHIEPLCGVYSFKGLERIFHDVQSAQLTTFSMIHAIQSMDTLLIDIDEEEHNAFLNLNRTGDIL